MSSVTQSGLVRKILDPLTEGMVLWNSVCSRHQDFGPANERYGSRLVRKILDLTKQGMALQNSVRTRQEGLAYAISINVRLIPSEAREGGPATTVWSAPADRFLPRARMI
jgi:hypothetical protein